MALLCIRRGYSVNRAWLQIFDERDRALILRVRTLGTGDIL